VQLDVPKHKRLALTDVVFGNPLNDTGLLTLARGDQVLFVEGLANFHDLPFHFGTPLVLDTKNTLTLTAECKNAATDTVPAAACTPAAYVTGTMSPVPQPAKKKPKVKVKAR
jgi:hypothetical protein